MYTQLPINYSSLYDELQYRLQITSKKDVTIVINDYNSSECIGVKKFYSTSDLTLNVAPIIRPFAMYTLESNPTGFLDNARQGFVTVQLEASADDTIIATSVDHTFTLSHSRESANSIVSTMPHQRLLSLGEQDIITVIGETNSAINATLYMKLLENGEYVTIQTKYASGSTDSSGIAQLAIRLDSEITNIGETIERIVVDISQNSAVIDSMEYIVSKKTHTATRVAWVSSRGSIEHYTFSTIENQQEKTDSTVITLLSAFETYETRSIIAEMISSPQVWVVVDDEYLEAQVVSNSIETSPFDAVATIEVELEF